MDKFYSCAVVSQRPTQFKFKYQEYMTSCKRLKKRLHDVFMELYRRGVRRYYVGGALGVDLWAGEILLEMRWQEECPELKIVLVYPFPGSRGVGAQGYKERTVYMVQCADCLVAVYNNDPQGAGSIRVAMRIAKTRRLPLVLIHPNTGKISRIG